MQSEHNSYYSSSSPQKSRNITVTAYFDQILTTAFMRKKIFLKFNGVIVGVTGPVLGVSNIWVTGHSSSAETGSRLTELRIN